MRSTVGAVFGMPEMVVTEHLCGDGSVLELRRLYERGSLPLYRVRHDDLVLWEGLGKSRGYLRFLHARRALDVF